jgi:tRNA 2-thiouridine synthesizing protein E
MSEHSITVNEVAIPTDHQGFLKNRLQWNADIADAIALNDGLTLSDEHWTVIDYYRDYYDDYNIPPPMRMLMRVFKKAHGEENANSRYLHKLFPEGPNRQASKIGGLPKPKNCK